MGKQEAAVPGGKKPKGGSALTRLRASLKDAGVIGKHQKISKKKSTTQRAAALSGRKEARDILRDMSAKTRDSNPFEMKVTRQKHEVMGRKVKGATGKPGAVRKRGEENRKRTLAVEMDRKNKDSAFVDRRFGEHDASMSMEDKMLERFMKEKSKRSDRGSMFNLQDNDDDEGMGELTHRGRALDEDVFNDAGLMRVGGDGEDSDGGGGQIDKNTVRYTHFGGFSDDEEGGPVGEDGRKKSKNEVMKEVIAKSKLHKRERQMQKEQDEDLADELDAQLDEIKGLLAPSKPRPARPSRDDRTGATDSNMVQVSNKRGRVDDDDDDDGVDADRATAKAAVFPDEPTPAAKEGEQEIEAYDDYDRFVRELASERRAKPTDRLKTEEELAQDEKNKLEQLEQDRQRRMLGLPTEKEEKAIKAAAKLAEAASRKRVAEADDLGDDDYSRAVDTMIEEEDEMPLTYLNGQLLNKEVFMRPKIKGPQGESSEDDEDEEESDEEDSEDEEDDDSEGDEDQDATADWAVEDVTEDIGDEELEIDSEIEEDSVLVDKTPKTKFVPAPRKTDDLAAKELPFTFRAPETHADFLELCKGRTVEEQAIIVQRIRALHHVKLGGDNRKKLEKLLDVLLEHLIYVAAQTPVDLFAIDTLSIPTIELSQQLVEQAADHFVSRITKLQKKLSRDLAASLTRRRGALPSVDALVNLKLVGRIFSTSDLTHAVVTPAMLLMGQYLSQCPVSDVRGAISGFIVCELFAEYQAQSKRLVPEGLNFLATILALLLPIVPSPEAEQDEATCKTVPILEPKFAGLRILDWSAARPEPTALSLLDALTGRDDVDIGSEAFKHALLVAAIKLLGRYARLYNEQPAFIELFAPFVSVLESIPLPSSSASSASSPSPSAASSSLTTSVSATLIQITSLISSTKLKRRPLLLQRFAPIPMATFVPKFDAHYSIDRKNGSRDPDRERADAAKLKYEYKKEFKGAVRELRKDAAFVARKRLLETRAKDGEYKKKMDKIMGGLANQEGAMRGYEREVKKAKGKR
ncbi:nucleolar complex protein 14 [Thoreauomyces humboldtii]|nr:nucleolar complex protein 14 [Thoreauomyces humboldtii]